MENQTRNSPFHREKLIKARAIASVLFEVLNTVYKVAGSKVSSSSLLNFLFPFPHSYEFWII